MSAATRIVRSFGSGNQKKWTMSFWMKVSRINYTDGGGGISRLVFGQTLSNYCLFIITGSTQKIQFYESQGMDLIPSMVFRDFNAWYHIVVAVDTAQATAANRVKIYVNGVQQTAFDTETYPAQNADLHFNKSGTHDIGGSSAYGGYNYFNGLLSHVHLTDGYAYAASDFGSTDSTTGEWKINTSPSVSYGTTGYWILKDGNGLTDQSPNSNDWTLSTGTLTKTEDNPSNVFATLNPLYHYLDGATLSNGNTGFNCGSSQNGRGMATIRPSTGKYYSEYKITNSSRFQIGIMNGSETNSNQGGSNANSVIVGYSGSCFFNNSSFTSYCGSFSNNDIVMIAIDCDNKLAWLGKNGTWFQSATATEIQNGTATNSLTTFISSQTPMSDTVGIFVEDNSGSGSTDGLFNFGNGNFGTTAVATNSGNGYAGAEGKSIFNYQPPTGYSALSTRGLNE